jgi:hypothetical protein
MGPHKGFAFASPAGTILCKHQREQSTSPVLARVAYVQGHPAKSSTRQSRGKLRPETPKARAKSPEPIVAWHIASLHLRVSRSASFNMLNLLAALAYDQRLPLRYRRYASDGEVACLVTPSYLLSKMC